MTTQGWENWKDRNCLWYGSLLLPFAVFTAALGLLYVFAEYLLRRD